MTQNTTDVSSPLGTKIITNDDVNATAKSNVTGGACSVYLIELTNSSAQAVYFKIFDIGAPVVGTTSPAFKVPVAAGGSLSVAFPSGLALITGLSYACTQEEADTGTTNPTSAVTLKMVTS
jgi:hypothetical protein